MLIFIALYLIYVFCIFALMKVASDADGRIERGEGKWKQ